LEADMKKRIKSIIMAVGITGVFLLSACTKKETIPKVRIGYFPNITHTQALVLKDQGTLEEKWKDQVEVSWTSFNAGPAEVEAIFAGEIDIGYIGPVPAINAYVKSNGDVQILTNATDAGAVLVKRADSDIETISDLAGKKVAIPQIGNTQHLCLLQILEENGLSATSDGGDVEVVAVENADVMNMMEQENIDAALVPEPWGSILESQCDARIVLDFDEIFLEGNYPTAVVVVRKEFLEQYPELVQEFLQEHEDAANYVNENEEELYNIVNRQIEQETSKSYDAWILKSAFDRIRVQAEINEEAIEAFGKICYEQAFIQEEMKEGIVIKNVN